MQMNSSANSRPAINPGASEPSASNNRKPRQRAHAKTSTAAIAERSPT